MSKREIDLLVSQEVAKIATKEKMDMQAKARIYIAAIVCLSALLLGLGCYAIYKTHDYVSNLVVEYESEVIETGDYGTIVQGNHNETIGGNQDGAN